MLPLTLPFTLLFTLGALLYSFTGYCVFIIYDGTFQKNIAPSDPTEIIVLWSGDILTLMIEPECP